MHVYTDDALEGKSLQQIADRGMSCRELSRRLAKEILQLMFAGTDTTSLTLSRTMTFLAKHPEWITALNEEQSRLMEEHGPEITPKVRPPVFLLTAPANTIKKLLESNAASRQRVSRGESGKHKALVRWLAMHAFDAMHTAGQNVLDRSGAVSI